MLAVLSLSVLVGCNLPQTGLAGSPTMSATQIYQTVDVRLTQALAQTPPVSPSPSPIDSVVPVQLTTAASSTTTAPPVVMPTLPVLCNLAAAGNPIDISIPDDTQMSPDQSFTKTWRLQNVGACTWTKDYLVALFSGEAMGAPASIALPESVPPGQTIDISIDMTAPHAAGRYQGNWKLRNQARVWFGIGPNGSSSFWVRIVVKQPPSTTQAATQAISSATPTQAPSTATSTPIPPTATVTQMPTPVTSTATISATHAIPSAPQATASPIVKDDGGAVMTPGDKLDLGTHQVNRGSGEDLSYEVNAAGEHLLIPQSTMVMSLFGEQEPRFDKCQTASMSAAPLIVESLPQGVYLCYRTVEGLPGRAHVENFNQSNGLLTLETVTWSLP